MYCSGNGFWVSIPNATSNAFNASGLTRPRNRAIIASAGLPASTAGRRS